jgi:hypothetical protein
MLLIDANVNRYYGAKIYLENAYLQYKQIIDGELAMLYTSTLTSKKHLQIFMDSGVHMIIMNSVCTGRLGGPYLRIR